MEALASSLEAIGRSVGVNSSMKTNNAQWLSLMRSIVQKPSIPLVKSLKERDLFCFFFVP